MKFHEYSTGLYYFDAAESHTTSENVIAYSFVNTVASNKSLYHRREVEAADRARALYCKIGRPSPEHFEHILSNNLIRNCPVTTDDARRAILIYGHDIAGIKGKTTKGKGRQAISFDPISIPTPLLAAHQKVTLCTDIFLCKVNHSYTLFPKKLNSGCSLSWKTRGVKQY